MNRKIGICAITLVIAGLLITSATGMPTHVKSANIEKEEKTEQNTDLTATLLTELLGEEMVRSEFEIISDSPSSASVRRYQPAGLKMQTLSMAKSVESVPYQTVARPQRTREEVTLIANHPAIATDGIGNSTTGVEYFYDDGMGGEIRDCILWQGQSDYMISQGTGGDGYAVFYVDANEEQIPVTYPSSAYRGISQETGEYMWAHSCVDFDHCYELPCLLKMTKGGATWLIDVTSDIQVNTSWNEAGIWNWGQHGWSDTIMAEVAGGNYGDAIHEWAWGFVAQVADSSYTGEIPYDMHDSPFIVYPFNDTGWATISWYYFEDNNHSVSCDAIIDHNAHWYWNDTYWEWVPYLDPGDNNISMAGYAVFDPLNVSENRHYIYMRAFDWTGHAPLAPPVSETDHSADALWFFEADAPFEYLYPCVEAKDGNLNMIMERHDTTLGETDVALEFWHTDDGNPDNLEHVGTVSGTDEQWRFADIGHVGGDVFFMICTRAGHNTLYAAASYDGGLTWDGMYTFSGLDEGGEIVVEDYRNVDISDNSFMIEWQWDNSTGMDILLQLYYTFNTLQVKGKATYDDGFPLDQVEAWISNLYSNHTYECETSGAEFSVNMLAGIDIWSQPFCAPLRVVARDPGYDDVNVSDVEICDIPTPFSYSNPPIIDLGEFVVWPHYLDVGDFPMIYALDLPGVGRQGGAAVAEAFLEFLMLAPYDQQAVYDSCKAFDPQPGTHWEGWYDAGDNISAFELMWGIGTPAVAHGYGFMAYANASSTPILEAICTLIDLDLSSYVDPGHPVHVPAAIPVRGGYQDWMIIRGIHTDKVTFPVPSSFEIYGFWVNDPAIEGIGENTYKTVDELLATYFLPMNLPSGHENGKFTCVVEPPETFELPEGQAIQYANQYDTYTKMERQMMRRASRMGLDTVVDKVIYEQAREGAGDILELAGKDISEFAPVQIVRVTSLVEGVGDYNLVVYSSGEEKLVVRTGQQSGQFLELSIAPDVAYLEGITTAYYTGGSAYSVH